MTYILKSFVLLVMCSLNIQAQESISVTQPININIVAPELKPLIYRSENGSVEGLIIDEIEQVNKNSHLNINVVLLPWARAMQRVIHGQADAIMPALYTEERAKLLKYPKSPIINFNGSVLIKRVKDDFNFTNFEAIKHKKSVAKVRAVLMGEAFEEAINKKILDIVEVTRIEDAVNMLLIERVDLAVADAFAAYAVIENMKIANQVVIMPISKDAEPSFVAFSRDFAEKYDINDIMTLINQYNNPSSYHKIIEE
ncbi:substrate-binding periplasmic protein [Colwelliaceae bacterium 6441]